MPEPFTGMTDILLGYDTDLHFEDGDLMLTTGIDYIEREIYKVLITEPGDWKTSPNHGGNPTRFVGEPNTREVGSQIRNYVRNALLTVVYPAQLDVRVTPVDYSKLYILITVLLNGVEISTVPLEFAFSSGFSRIINRDSRVQKKKSSSKYKINDISNTRTPNKYWDRLRQRTFGRDS